MNTAGGVRLGFRICIVGSSILLASAAASVADEPFDGPAVAEIYYDVRGACRQGETVKGEQLTQEESAKQCLILDALGEQLRDHGYCWYNSEQEWVLCKDCGWFQRCS
jgi:hypothetical protein